MASWEPSGTGSGNRAGAAKSGSGNHSYAAKPHEVPGTALKGTLSEQGRLEAREPREPREPEPNREPVPEPKRRSGKLSRRKGRAFQAELAKRWRDGGLFPEARSTQGEQKCRRQDKPADIEGTPFAVEAKHRRSCRPLQALVQSEAEAEGRADWRDAIAVVKPNGSAMADCVVVMRLSSFETLVRKAQPVAAGTFEAELAMLYGRTGEAAE